MTAAQPQASVTSCRTLWGAGLTGFGCTVTHCCELRGI